MVRPPTDWCALFPGYHLYYQTRCQATSAFAVLAAALPYRNPGR